MRSSRWRSFGVSQSDTSGSCVAGVSVLRLPKAAPPHGVDQLARGFEILRSTSLSPLFLAHYGLDTPLSNWAKPLQSPINCPVLPCLPLYSLMFPYVPLLFSEVFPGFFPPSPTMYAARSV